LSRQRAPQAAEKAAATNRTQKVLEDCNVKLAAVATDALGASGRDILEALIPGEGDPEQLADRARGRLRQKTPALQAAPRGRITEHHRFRLRLLLDHWAHLEALVGRLGARIEDVMAPFSQSAERLTTVPGVEQRTAEVVLAEVGTDMGQFPSAAHLASWAGPCPGNNESAGKRRSGRDDQGEPVAAAGVDAGGVGGHTKDTYLAAQFRRLAARQEAGAGGGGAHAVGDHLPPAEGRR
jgi:transposase